MPQCLTTYLDYKCWRLLNLKKYLKMTVYSHFECLNVTTNR